MIVNATELGEIMGVHRSTVVKWTREGCPFLQKSDKRRNQEWQFESSDVMRWREEVAVKNAVGDTEETTEEELRRRKLAAETSISEIQAAKEKGLVVEIEEVVKTITDDYVKLKQRLRTIPARVAPILIGEDNETIIKNEISSGIDEALNELSTQFIEWEEESNSPD